MKDESLIITLRNPNYFLHAEVAIDTLNDTCVNIYLHSQRSSGNINPSKPVHTRRIDLSSYPSVSTANIILSDKIISIIA